ncbi:MAG: M15 family metallopeptidase [Clostridiaceae bacterium]|nr:M15 family metallopeptidase [Clostridiaceae bacterium]
MKKGNSFQRAFGIFLCAAIVLSLLYFSGAMESIIEVLPFAKEKPRMNRVDLTESELFSFSTDGATLDRLGITRDDALFLINRDHPVPEDREFAIDEYKTSGVLMNRAMLEDYARLSAAVTERTNDKLYVMSSFRSFEKQRALFDEDPETAAEPGFSEHHSGLALDVYVYMYAGAGFLNSEAGKFVNRNAHDYGFIIRYPRGKEKVTGFPFEPWHIRYVGSPHARYISLNNITLEEYIESLEEGVFYEIDGSIVSRQIGDLLYAPQKAIDITVSEDNTGGYIITAKMK